MDVGNYTLLHLLGRGGTSEVYAAEHRERGDRVAVKLVRTSEGADLVAEATRVRDIQHPNVVRMIEVGSDESSCYLVMELIEGETLAARLRRDQRLDERELREIGAAIADGMQAAHARGIVHRDLKPGNVMLRDEVPVVVDFGIAKSLGSATVAVTERRVGTVAYMAPEQLVDGLITPAVDIWALGVTLFEAAMGQLPFTSFQDGRLPQLFESPPRVSTTTPALADLIARCLDRDPGKRPASMADIARALRADDGDRLTADIGSTIARAPAAKKRWPLFLAGVGGLVAIAAALVITRAPAKPAAAPPIISTPAAVDAAVTAPVVVAPVEAAAPVDESPVESAVDESPARETPRAPTKRTKPRPKPRTTSQGETLD